MTRTSGVTKETEGHCQLDSAPEMTKDQNIGMHTTQTRTLGRYAPTLLGKEGRASTLVLETQRPLEVGSPKVIIRLKVLY